MTASERSSISILQGLLKACEKRPVPVGKLETIVDEAEAFVSEAAERERTTTEIGELLMNRLKKLDKVAYVRFASVYLDFKDVKEFMDELKGLLKDRSEEISADSRYRSTMPCHTPAANVFTVRNPRCS